jgi:uncharacterized protein (TIGR02270 family)
MRRPSILAGILEDHLDEVLFLFRQRCLALEALDLGVTHLAEIEERLDAHVDGLRVGRDSAWELCSPLLTAADPGSIFAAAALALASGNDEYMDEVEKAVQGASADSREGLLWAWRLAQHPGAVERLRAWSASNDETLQAAAVDALSFRKIDPGEARERGLAGTNPIWLCASARASGRLRSLDSTARVRALLEAPDPAVACAALEALAVLDPETARGAARARLDAGGPVSVTAALILGALGDARDIAALERSAAAEEPALSRAGFLALGNLGYGRTVATLLELLGEDRRGKVAGATLRRILGPRPPWASLAPGAEQEEAADWLPEDDLPAWQPEPLRAWWASSGHEFEAGVRYYAGAATEAGRLRPESALAWRRLEALEEAVASGKAPLETCGRAAWQHSGA